MARGERDDGFDMRGWDDFLNCNDPSLKSLIMDGKELLDREATCRDNNGNYKPASSQLEDCEILSWAWYTKALHHTARLAATERCRNMQSKPRYGTVWYGHGKLCRMVSKGMVMVMVWYGMVWYGMVWCNVTCVRVCTDGHS